MPKKSKHDKKRNKESIATPLNREMIKSVSWGTITGIIGVLASLIATMVALRANQIATETLKPRLTTQTAFVYVELPILMDNPDFQICKLDHAYFWETDILIGLDISNTGSNPFSITEITLTPPDFNNPVSREVINYMNMERIDNSNELMEWKSRLFQRDDISNVGNVSFENLPALIANGSTIRILVGITHFAVWVNFADIESIPLESKNPTLDINVKIVLGDGTYHEVITPVKNYFLLAFDTVKTSDIKDCQSVPIPPS